MTHRIGPKMKLVVEYVERHPGCSKLEVAEAVVRNNPNARNMGVIYAPVNRAIDMGLIDAVREGNRYRLTAPE